MIMTAEDIRQVMHQNVPFVIKSADGSNYQVRHPDFISVGQNGDGVVVVHTASSLAILALENITAIEISQTASSA